MINHLFKFLVGINIFVGLVFTICTPPFMTPDENRHIVKVVSNGSMQQKVNIDNKYSTFIDHFIDKNERSYKVGLNKIADEFNIEYQVSKEIEVHNYNHKYLAITYLPQIIGFNLSKIFSEKPIIQLLGARLSVFICSVLLMIFCLIQYNSYKWLILAIFTFPTTQVLRSAIMVDIFIVALVLLIVLSSLEILNNQNSRQNFLILFISSLSVIFFKTVYSVIFAFSIYCLLLSFLGKRIKLNSLITYTLVVIISFITYNYLNFMDLNQSISNDSSNNVGGIFIYKLINTLKQNGYNMTGTMFGILGWSDVFMPPFTLKLCFLITFFLVIFYNQKSIKISIISSFTLFSFIIFIYFVFNKIQGQFNLPTNITNKIIWGVQGRYFLPFFPIIIFAVYIPQKIYNFSEILLTKVEFLMFTGLFFINMLSVYKLLTFFY